MSPTSEDNKINLKKSLKITSLFGGVQIFGIIISILKNKCVALLIGPTGVGLVELYNSTLRLIKSFTDFSIQVSAVRDVSIAYRSSDENKYHYTAFLFSRIVWLTGLLGLFICLLGSPLWSKLTFGNYKYTLSFVLLSSILLFNQLQSGKSVLLQGAGHYKELALSSILGNLFGLITTIPIYYFWGIDGIIPVLLISAVISYCLFSIYAKRVLKTSSIKLSISISKILKEGSYMLKQGYLISINYILSALVFYILRIFITDNGGVNGLGLYTASSAIVSSYVGLVFQAMSQEYYPRISALSSDNNSFNKSVDEQIFLTLLIIGPLVAIFLTFSDQILVLLYSDKFTEASALMAISMFGVFFQAPSWCMSYTLLAKGDNKVFLLSETIAKLVRILLDIMLYLIWGLTGLGISFVISYIFYTIQCSLICKKKYGFKMGKINKRILLLYSIMGILLLLIFLFYSPFLRIIVGLFLLFSSCLFSYYQVNKIVNVKEIIKSKFLKK